MRGRPYGCGVLLRVEFEILKISVKIVVAGLSALFFFASASRRGGGREGFVGGNSNGLVCEELFSVVFSMYARASTSKPFS